MNADCKTDTKVNAICFCFRGCNNIPSKIKSDIIQRFGEKVFEYGDYIKFAIIGIVGLVILWFAIKWIIKKIKKS